MYHFYFENHDFTSETDVQSIFIENIKILQETELILHLLSNWASEKKYQEH